MSLSHPTFVYPHRVGETYNVRFGESHRWYHSKAHTVTVLPNSWLHSVERESQVNSFHYQGIDKLAPDPTAEGFARRYHRGRLRRKRPRFRSRRAVTPGIGHGNRRGLAPHLHVVWRGRILLLQGALFYGT
jgi:hypothetical protein